MLQLSVVIITFNEEANIGRCLDALVGVADEVVVLSDVAENSVMYLAHGNRDSLIAAARQAMEDCGKPAAVERCFISDCYSRVLMLGDDFGRELETACSALRNIADIELEGVQALGEIAAKGTQKLAQISTCDVRADALT